MEDRVPKGRLRRGAALVACAAGISCGTGVHDGEGDWYVTRIVDPAGGEIAFKEAILHVSLDSLDGPAPITLRRYPTIEHAGAIGPVFEIEVPKPETLTKDPGIGILASSDVVSDPNNVIALRVPAVGWWFPATSATPVDFACPTLNKCGDVQVKEFTTPDGAQVVGLTTTTLQIAIVQKCGKTSECATGQDLACNAGACQTCPQDSVCQP